MKKNIIMTLVSISALTILVCCSTTKNQDDFKKFYFPTNSFFEEKIYCYQDRNNASESSYWRLQTITEGKDTFLLTEIFNSKFLCQEKLKEIISNSGSDIVEYVMFEYDSINKSYTSSCELVKTRIFSWNQKVGEQIQWKVNYCGALNTNYCTTLTKTRTLKTVSTSDGFIEFDDQFEMTVENKADNRQQTYNYAITSIYTNKKGLTSYKLNLPSGKVLDYNLNKVISKKEWDEMKTPKIQN